MHLLWRVDGLQVKSIITEFLDTIPNNKKEEVRDRPLSEYSRP